MADPALTSGELAWVLSNSQPEVVITTPEGWPVLKKAIAECDSQKVKSALVKTGNRVFIVDPANDDYGLTDVDVALARARAYAGTYDWRTLLGRQALKKPVTFPLNESPAALLSYSGHLAHLVSQKV